MSSRTYLSIGDVLTLLRDEFPDVTISKIRFLESQGLVNPERSPSGYRKFFDQDVERLRWVLRQQREHFLPLKVIRDRLADGDLDDAPADHENGKTSTTEAAHARPGPTAAVAAAGGGAGDPAHGHGTEEQATKADEAAMARILADASRRTARLPAEAAPARPGQPSAGEEPGGPAGSPSDAAARPARQRATGPAGATGVGAAAQPSSSSSSSGPRHAAGAAPTGRGGGEASAERQGSSTSSRPSAGGGAAAAGTPSGRRGQPSGGAGAGPATTAGIVTGASLTADELCAACGLSPEELAGLESFGLIQAVAVAGIPTYDEDALTIANLAASFRGFGIEPRHLRLYRNAADREMGLIEQVVIPLLRQRNPESRQRAVESADQLAALGQSMRATLLRLALRRHLGG